MWNDHGNRSLLHSKNIIFTISSKSFGITEGKYLGGAHASAADPGVAQILGPRKILGWPLGRPRSPQERPKIAPRRPKIDPKINQNFDQFSVSILDRFWVVLGPQLGVIFDQISSPNRLGTGFTSKTSISTKS